MSETKKEIVSIAEKNRIIDKIIDTMVSRDNFILMGHKNPDEDCMASMVAFGLLLSKMSKKCFLLTCDEMGDNFQYLLNICRFNSITVLEGCTDPPEDISAAVFLDTPKPSMLTHPDILEELNQRNSVVKIEIDHHLEADSSYIGDPGYRLVNTASSSCELVGLLAFKLNNRQAVLSRYQISQIFTRNFILAVLTGMIGDSQMGKYLKSARERWFYNLFSGMFNEMLGSETYKDSNFSDMQEVYSEIFRLSREEEECYTRFLEYREESAHIGYIVLDESVSAELMETFGHETVLSIARTAADTLAEESGYISLVGYYDNPDVSPLVQFRMRRSQHFRDLDLRKVIDMFSIGNGGGHAGAIGFRIARNEIPSLTGLVNNIVSGTEKMLDMVSSDS